MSAKHQVVKHKVGKLTFEVLTKPGAVTNYRKGLLGWDRVLVADEVFTKYQKGERASKSDLQSAFKTEDIAQITKLIVEKGELQVSAQERAEEVTRKKRELLTRLSTHYIDPTTKKPHPVSRIESSLDQIRLVVAYESNVDKLVEEAQKKLVGILSLKKVDFSDASVTVEEDQNLSFKDQNLSFKDQNLSFKDQNLSKGKKDRR